MTSLLARRARAGFLTASLLIAAAAPAAAQSAQPDQLQAAREVIELSGAASSLRDIVPVFFDEARQTFTRTRPEIAKDLDEAIKVVTPEFEKRRDQLMTDIAIVYAQRFTAQELGEIKAFYLTPTGKKLVGSMPGILQESYQKTQIWSARMSQEIVSRLRAEMKKRGVDI